RKRCPRTARQFATWSSSLCLLRSLRQLDAIGADFLGQAEDSLAQDVLLDLGRASRDRATVGASQGVRPGAGLAVVDVVFEGDFLRRTGRQQPVGAQDLVDQVLHPLVQLGAM